MSKKSLVSFKSIENKILFIRGQKVILDRDLAGLYGVATKRLNEQVKRNIKRFPEDFLIRLTKKEMIELVANCDRFAPLKHSTTSPQAFTENGVAMLSSVLNSEKAIEVNIQIMRIFTKLRKLLISNKEIASKVSGLEKSVGKNKKDIEIVFKAMNQLISPEKHAVFTLSKTNMTVVNQEIQEALSDLHRKPKPDITGSIQHATAAVECILRNITGDHNATLGQILKKRKDIIPSPLNISVEKAWGVNIHEVNIDSKVTSTFEIGQVLMPYREQTLPRKPVIYQRPNL